MKVKATLTLTVWYDDCKDLQEAQDSLEINAEQMVGNGLTLDNSPAIVDTYNLKVETEKVY